MLGAENSNSLIGAEDSTLMTGVKERSPVLGKKLANDMSGRQHDASRRKVSPPMMIEAERSTNNHEWDSASQ